MLCTTIRTNVPIPILLRSAWRVKKYVPFILYVIFFFENSVGHRRCIKCSKTVQYMRYIYYTHSDIYNTGDNPLYIMAVVPASGFFRDDV